MNNKNIKPETAVRPGGVKKGLTTPVVPTMNPLSEGLTTPVTPKTNQPTGTPPSNQAPSAPADQSGNKSNNSNGNG